MTIRPTAAPHVPRELEWAGALVLLGVALSLLAPGATFSRPTFNAFQAIAPEGTWGMGLLGIATVRMLGLWINGNWRRSPTIRCGTAFAGAAAWFGLAWLLAHDGYPGWNTGVGAYAALGLLDVFAFARSSFDQGRNDRRHALARRAAA
ncbi:hypothetical protein OKC48_07530 [Methylorubrum extorquens]|uniref:hypothetical protein n=1 Tax=Methylorubrum extorquens TaxID=408 RepID=UPI0022384FD5|nr:hypothetical protein [Methylorubrum extorquens]UYW28357.1 hypothetical protein OKC48_07530 [Methylorubrum extorquens]